MLDEKDLQSIEKLTDQQKKDIIREVSALIEQEVTSKFNALAEGQRTILEMLAPNKRVTELEAEVKLLKSILDGTNLAMRNLAGALSHFPRNM